MSNPIRFLRKEFLCEVEVFLLNRQAAQDHAEAIKSLASGSAALRRQRIRRFEAPQLVAKSKPAPEKATTSGSIAATPPPDATPAIPEAAVKTFTWQKTRPHRR